MNMSFYQVKSLTAVAMIPSGLSNIRFLTKRILLFGIACCWLKSTLVGIIDFALDFLAPGILSTVTLIGSIIGIGSSLLTVIIRIDK